MDGSRLISSLLALEGSCLIGFVWKKGIRSISSLLAISRLNVDVGLDLFGCGATLYCRLDAYVGLVGFGRKPFDWKLFDWSH